MNNPAPRSKPVIGLAGGIGSGKTLVAKHFESLGCGVINADQLATQAMDDPTVIEQLKQWWGSGVVGPEGKIDRRAVAKIVFDDPEQLQRLERLVHPLVHQGRQRQRRAFDQNPDIVAVIEDCPLLLEKHIDQQCDTVVFVDSTLENRLKRVTAQRGWSPDELARREKFQTGLDIKAKRADYVIDNNAGQADCLLQVRRVLSQILQGQS